MARIHAQPVPAPQARAYLDTAPARPPLWEEPLEELRRSAREDLLAVAGAPEPVAQVDELRAGDVPARLYRPVGGERDALVWLHGGGWVVGDVDCFDALARALANRAGCAVLSVDYRLAPEHRFPAAIDDAWAATRWAAERFERIAVGGDSAGGNLAAATALRARDAGIALALQLLVYPVLDGDIETPFYRGFAERYARFAGRSGYGATQCEEMRFFWDAYVPDPAARAAPDASPLRAASLGGLAPALIVTAEHDVLRGEAEAYARRLAAAAVPVELCAYAGQIHGFAHMLGAMDDAHDAVDRAAAALRRGLAHGGEDAQTLSC